MRRWFSASRTGYAGDSPQCQRVILGRYPRTVPGGNWGLSPRTLPNWGLSPVSPATSEATRTIASYELDQTPGTTPRCGGCRCATASPADRWVRLSLRGAQPRIAGTALPRSPCKNANGGRQVTLDVTPEHASLDVFVDHGLEVNIEPDLDPAVDRMNTNGPLTALDCTVAPQ